MTYVKYWALSRARVRGFRVELVKVLVQGVFGVNKVNLQKN